jgi:hypothetical protein
VALNPVDGPRAASTRWRSTRLTARDEHEVALDALDPLDGGGVLLGGAHEVGLDALDHPPDCEQDVALDALDAPRAASTRWRSTRSRTATSGGRPSTAVAST